MSRYLVQTIATAASGRDLGIRKKNEILAHLQNITGFNTPSEEGKEIILSNRFLSFLCIFFFSPVMPTAPKSGIAGQSVIPLVNADERLCTHLSLPFPWRHASWVTPGVGNERLSLMKARECPLLSLVTTAICTCTALALPKHQSIEKAGMENTPPKGVGVAMVGTRHTWHGFWGG